MHVTGRVLCALQSTNAVTDHSQTQNTSTRAFRKHEDKPIKEAKGTEHLQNKKRAQLVNTPQRFCNNHKVHYHVHNSPPLWPPHSELKDSSVSTRSTLILYGPQHRKRTSNYEGRTESHEQLFFLHANWEQQTKESAVVDGTSCCVILECPVTSIACIT